MPEIDELTQLLDAIKATLQNGSNGSDSRSKGEKREGPIEQMVNCILTAPNIFVYGVGRSGLVGKAFAMRLVQMGFQTFFIGETITPIVKKGDVVIVISNTGQTMSAVQTANISGRVGAKIVAVTGNSQSKLGHAADIIIPIELVRDRNRREYAPLGTLFEDATLILLDSVVAVIMKRTGQSEKDMKQRHSIMV